MHSKAMQTAFTSLTLGLVVFLSLWVIQSSHDELMSRQPVPLQVKSKSEKPNSTPDPFADPQVTLSLDDSESRESNRSRDGGRLPVITPLEKSSIAPPDKSPGITASTVANQKTQSVPAKQAPPAPPLLPILSNEKTTAPPERKSAALPMFEFPPLDATAKPAQKLPLTEPVAAPQDPAWLSAQAVLEEEIKTLKQSQQRLQKELDSRDRKINNVSTEKQKLAAELSGSKSEVQRLEQSTIELRDEAAEMKTSLSEMSREFETLRKQLDSLNRPVITPAPKRVAQRPLTEPTRLKEPLPLPPAEAPTPKSQSSESKALEDLYDPQTPLPKVVPEPQTFSDPIISELPYGSTYEGQYYETIPAQPQKKKRRGLLVKLKDKWSRRHDDDSCTSTSCTETILDCEPLEECREKRGLLGQIGSWFIKDDDCCDDCTETIVPCGAYEEAYTEKRGLIPKMKSWWRSRRGHDECEGCPNCRPDGVYYGEHYVDSIERNEVIYGIPSNVKYLSAQPNPQPIISAEPDKSISVPLPAPGVE